MKRLGSLYLKKVLRWYFIGICFLFYASLLKAETYTREGLYLRWASGVHYGELFESIPPPARDKYPLSSIYAYATDFAVGYTFFNSFIPYVRFFHIGSFDSQISFHLQGWATGFIYYFMPSNIFVSLGGKEITSGRWHPVSDDDRPFNDPINTYDFQEHSSLPIVEGHGSGIRFSNAILGTDLMIGKEFWISPEYSIGIALHRESYYFTVRNPYNDTFAERKYGYTSYGLGFILTYN